MNLPLFCNHGDCVLQKVTGFTHDAISLTEGEELNCGEAFNIFSTLRREFGKWIDHLDRSGEKCKCRPVIFDLVVHKWPSAGFTSEIHICLCDAVSERLEKEVAVYEEKYRGRELPGFINYKTFESLVKEQVKQLEEPAVKTLKDIGGI